MIKNLPPLSIYVHIPWCVKKCPYCDFNAHQIKKDCKITNNSNQTDKYNYDLQYEEKYVSALIDDFNISYPYIQNREIISIFFGGGTPSLFSPKSIYKILNNIKKNTKFNKNIEITLEANPSTVNLKRLREYSCSGINRLSIGVQSLNNNLLKEIGRDHNKDDSIQCINWVKQIFQNFNVDIMYGLPKQDVNDLKKEIKDILSFEIPHLSIYQLSIEPKTLFFKNRPILPNDNNLYQMDKLINSLLNDYKYNNYEVSAYAQETYESKHNLNYWQFGDYLGIGAGSHSKISYGGDIIREIKFKNPKKYIFGKKNNYFIQKSYTVIEKDLAVEFLMNIFRLSTGFDKEIFEKRTGQKIESIYGALEKAKTKDLIFEKDKTFFVSKKGKLFLNNLIELFL